MWVLICVCPLSGLGLRVFPPWTLGEVRSGVAGGVGVGNPDRWRTINTCRQYDVIMTIHGLPRVRYDPDSLQCLWDDTELPKAMGCPLPRGPPIATCINVAFTQ